MFSLSQMMQDQFCKHHKHCMVHYYYESVGSKTKNYLLATFQKDDDEDDGYKRSKVSIVGMLIIFNQNYITHYCFRLDKASGNKKQSILKRTQI